LNVTCACVDAAETRGGRWAKVSREARVEM
jgi:hypothetical protein